MGFDVGSIIKNGAEGLLKGVDAVLARFIQSPNEKSEALIEITKVSNSHVEEMARLAQQSAEAELKAKQAELDAANADRDGARQMNIKLQMSAEASRWAKITPYCMAIFVTFIWGVVTIYIVARVLKLIPTTGAPPDITAVLGIYSGLCTLFGTLLNFFFGSSKSSQVKDETIANMAKTI